MRTLRRKMMSTGTIEQLHDDLYDYPRICDVDPHVEVVAELFDKYNDGIEPISEWLTKDLSSLVEALEKELKLRAEAEWEKNGPDNAA
jgi:hypothetical protein